MTNPFPGQQQQQPQGPAVSYANPNLRIQHGDQNFPRELWGKTVREAMEYYGIMRQEFLRVQAEEQARAAQGQQPQQPQYQQPQQPQQPQRPGFQQPQYPQRPQQPQAPQGSQVYDEAAVRRIVQEAVATAIAPLQGPSQAQVYQQVRSKFPDWNFYDADIQTSLQDAEPGSLLNPAVWEAAYFYIKGKKLSEQPAPAPHRPQDPFNREGVGPRGERITPAPDFPAQGHAFVEGPSAPANSGNGAAMQDPNDELMARRFGVTVDDYRRWKGGQVPPMPQPQQQQPQQPQFQQGGNNGWR